MFRDAAKASEVCQWRLKKGGETKQSEFIQTIPKLIMLIKKALLFIAKMQFQNELKGFAKYKNILDLIK